VSIIYDFHPKIALNELLDDLIFDLPDLPDEAAVQFLRRAAIKMCREGNLLRRKALIYTQPCVSNYILEPIDCVDVVAIMNTRNVSGSLGRGVVRLSQEPADVPCGMYSWWTPPNEINFTQVGCNYHYEVGFSIAPKFDACEIDVDLTNRHYELLLLGAKSYAHDLNDKPWTNLTKSRDYSTRFIEGIRSAAVETMMGGQRGVFRYRKTRVL